MCFHSIDKYSHWQPSLILTFMNVSSKPIEGISFKPCTVKPVLSGHLKIDKIKVLMENGCLMKVKSIPGAFYNTFDLH